MTKLKQTQFCTFEIEVNIKELNADIQSPVLQSTVIAHAVKKATVGETLEQHNATIREPWKDTTYPEDSTPVLYCGTNYTNSGLKLASGQFSIVGYIGASSPSFVEIENFGSNVVWLSKATSNLDELENIYYLSVCNGTDSGKISATFYSKRMYTDITSKTTNIILKKEHSDKLGDVLEKLRIPREGLDVSGNYGQYPYDDTLLITNTTEVNVRTPDSKQVQSSTGLGNAALIRSGGIGLGDNIPVFMVPVVRAGRVRMFSSIDFLGQSKSSEQVIRIEIDEANSKITTFFGKSIAKPVLKQRKPLEFTKYEMFADALTNNDSADITSTANGLTQILRSSDGQTIMLAYKEAKDASGSLGMWMGEGMSSGTLSLYDVNSQLMKVYGICDIERLATTILKFPILGIKVKLPDGKTADDYLDISLNGYADISSSYSSTGDLVLTITEYESVM